ncbi:unnamed protein product, partial [Meganyctiphanes norvegica]
MSGTPEKAAVTTTSPKSSPSKKEVDAATQALNHFAQGKRHLLVNDINSAVNSLQEACRMLAEQHGETAPECGDAYFYYGRALLEMARIESGVLGNALDGVPEGEDMDSSQVENPDKMPEDEKEKVAEQVGEALEENFKSLTKASPTKDAKANGHAKDEDKVNGKSDEPKKDSEKSDTKAEGKSESPVKDKKEDSAMDTDSGKKSTDDESSQDGDSQDGESQEEGEEGGEGQEEGGEDGEEEKEGEGEKTEEEEEDVSNLQLAWEMLELAKVIYQRQEEGNKAMSLKTAGVFLKLGEVGLESENYPQSIEDFQSCLKIQETHMEADDRCLAETHYQLGVAHSFSDDFDNSIESFTKASKIITERIDNLEKNKKEKEGWTEEQKKKHAETCEDPFYTEDAEIQELNTLLPEIKEKIVDMEEMKKDSKEKINKVKKELGMASAIGGSTPKEAEGSTNAFGFGSSSSTASDAKPIATTMIRKK